MIAQDVLAERPLLEFVLKELEDIESEVAQAPDADAAEEAVLAWSRRLGRQVLEQTLQARVEQHEQHAPRECECGGRLRVHSRQPRSVLTLLGEVRLGRRYFYCRRCRAHSFPGDGWLSWPGAFSLRLEEAVAHEVAALPYRQALAGLRKLLGVEISVAGAQAIVARWGEAKLWPEPYAEPIQGRLVAQWDGTTVHLEEGDREVKVAAIMALEGGKATQVSYVADLVPAAQFGPLVWRELLVRGAPRVAERMVCGDGAPWVWEVASWVLPRATEILDWFHATEHLWEAAQAAHGEGKPPTQALAQRWKEALWEGQVEGIVEELQELHCTRLDPEGTFRKNAHYFDTHQARLRYPVFREAGWPIGSGVVEGGCKHVIDIRLKRKSTRWKRPGLRRVLYLRLDRLNERWEHRTQYMKAAA